jgi:hypothetical protein
VYNNGIVVVADDIHLGTTSDGGPGIRWLKGMQIVNGGQTTASIHFTKKRTPEIDLARVHVPARIIVLRNDEIDEIDEDGLIADISRYANSQNSVKLSDLSANKPFHVQIEQLALSTYCPDGIGRWFYERAAGSYNTMLAREGTTPARLRQLRDAIPTSRKITKTDLAKFLNAWAQKPDAVSFGSQNNFERLMADLTQDNPPLPDVQWYKQMIAKTIIFKRTISIVRPRFQAFQANITTYVVSLVAKRLGPELDLDKVWQRQDISPELKQQITEWAGEVNQVLHQTAAGRMVSEWAKKPECWEAVREASYSDPIEGIPERRGQLV